jgi:nitroreductase
VPSECETVASFNANWHCGEHRTQTQANNAKQIMSHLPKAEDHRKPDYPIESLFFRRWSPRAMSGQPLTEKELLTLFEAARWAPSTFNEQEWRFLYARRDTSHWPIFFGLLMEANQVWCQKAAVLVVALARKTFSRNGKPNSVFLFDTGSAWENLALQATAMGLVAHGMAGFDFERARTELRVPDDFAVAAMFALGRPGNPDDLPAEAREREVPSPRRPVRESICEGPFAAGQLAP